MQNNISYVLVTFKTRSDLFIPVLEHSTIEFSGSLQTRMMPAIAKALGQSENPTRGGVGFRISPVGEIPSLVFFESH